MVGPDVAFTHAAPHTLNNEQLLDLAQCNSACLLPPLRHELQRRNLGPSLARLREASLMVPNN
jgi:hypothetical protein